MRKINSREDLMALNAQYRDHVLMRLLSYDSLNRTEVTVTVGECGMTNGAKDTLTALFNEVNNAKVDDVSVIAVDCADDCGNEPIVKVIFPGKEPLVFNNVDSAKAKEIAKEHLIKKGGVA
ncbi:MAG: hypothetical protein FWC73_11595 [Defluviitaleaceae bacterium]|nr:hypothetical protein [Defluviitaleaceae bacterium]